MTDPLRAWACERCGVVRVLAIGAAPATCSIEHGGASCGGGLHPIALAPDLAPLPFDGVEHRAEAACVRCSAAQMVPLAQLAHGLRWRCGECGAWNYPERKA